MCEPFLRIRGYARDFDEEEDRRKEVSFPETWLHRPDYSAIAIAFGGVHGGANEQVSRDRRVILRSA